MNKNIQKLKELYKLAEEAKVGEMIICPSCGIEFKKEHYQTKFCKTKGGTICKDHYWNNVTPNKKNNTTRISPASAAWLNRKENYSFNPDNCEHPFSSEALGQWND